MPLGEPYDYIYVCTVLHTQRLCAKLVRLRTETQTGAYGSGQVECTDMKITQPLGAKPEVRNQSDPLHTHGENLIITVENDHLRQHFSTKSKIGAEATMFDILEHKHKKYYVLVKKVEVRIKTFPRYSKLFLLPSKFSYEKTLAVFLGFLEFFQVMLTIIEELEQVWVPNLTAKELVIILRSYSFLLFWMGDIFQSLWCQSESD